MNHGDRFRWLQQTLRLVSKEESRENGKPSLALLVPGIDGNNNAGSSVLAKWLLLGATGQAAAEPVIDAEHEAVEDSVIAITAEGVDVYYVAPATRWMEQALLHWPRLEEYFLSADEMEDTEEAELFKVRAFIEMVRGHQHVVLPAVAPPASSHGATAAWEQWPLIQTYGLSDLGTGGFFSMQHTVHAREEACCVVLHHVDALHLSTLVKEAVPSLEEQWQLTLASAFPIQRHASPSPSSPWSSLTEERVLEPLSTFVEFARLRAPAPRSVPQGLFLDATPAWHQATPRVLFGIHTLDLTARSDSRAALQAGVEGAPARHMLLDVEDPGTGVRVCRTYFLHPPGRPETFERAHDAEESTTDDGDTLLGLYALLVRAHQAGLRALEQLPAPALTRQGSDLMQAARSAFAASVRPWSFPAARRRLPPGFQPIQQLRLRMETRSALGVPLGCVEASAEEAASTPRRRQALQVHLTSHGDISLLSAERGRPLVYMSLSLLEIPRPVAPTGGRAPELGPLLGSVSVGDTLVLAPSHPLVPSVPVEVTTESSDAGGTPTSGDRSPTTVVHCLTKTIPYSWSAGGRSAARDSSSELGESLGPPISVIRLLTGGSLLPWTSGRIELCAKGFRWYGASRRPLEIPLVGSNVQLAYLSGSEAARLSSLPLATPAARSAATRGWIASSDTHVEEIAIRRWQARTGDRPSASSSSVDPMAVEAARQCVTHPPDVLVVHWDTAGGDCEGLPRWSRRSEEQSAASVLALAVPEGSTAKSALLRALTTWRKERGTYEEDDTERGSRERLGGDLPPPLHAAYRAAASDGWLVAWEGCAMGERIRLADAFETAKSGPIAEGEQEEEDEERRAEGSAPQVSIPVVVLVGGPGPWRADVAQQMAKFAGSELHWNVVVSPADSPAMIRSAEEGPHREFNRAAAHLVASCSSSSLARLVWVAPPLMTAHSACAWVQSTGQVRGVDQPVGWHVGSCHAVWPRDSLWRDTRHTVWTQAPGTIVAPGFVQSLLLLEPAASSVVPHRDPFRESRHSSKIGGRSARQILGRANPTLRLLRVTLERHGGVSIPYEMAMDLAGRGIGDDSEREETLACQGAILQAWRTWWDPLWDQRLPAALLPPRSASLTPAALRLVPRWVPWALAVEARALDAVMECVGLVSQDVAEASGFARHTESMTWCAHGALRVLDGSAFRVEEIVAAPERLVHRRRQAASPGRDSAQSIHGIGLIVWTPVGMDGSATRSHWRSKLDSCRPSVPQELPQRTAQSLTREERAALRQAFADAPLPDGVVFDGSSYVDFAGRRYSEHPDMERFQNEFLRAWNNYVHRFNDQVRSVRQAKEAEEATVESSGNTVAESLPALQDHWWDRIPPAPASSMAFIPGTPQASVDLCTWVDPLRRGSARSRAPAEREAVRQEPAAAGDGGYRVEGRPGGSDVPDIEEDEEEGESPFVLGHRVPGMTVQLGPSSSGPGEPAPNTRPPEDKAEEWQVPARQHHGFLPPTVGEWTRPVSPATSRARRPAPPVRGRMLVERSPQQRTTGRRERRSPSPGARESKEGYD